MRAVRAALAGIFMAPLLLLGAGAATGAPAIGAPAVGAPATGVPGSGFSASETITRSHAGADNALTTVDTRTVHVSVDETKDLHGRQGIAVSWSGAHPTGGVATDPNAQSAEREEFPVVIMECRGVDSAAATPAQRLDPTTCWTQTADERYQETFKTAFPQWRLDRMETAADRGTRVNPAPPATPPAVSCDDGALAERYVPFVAPDSTVYYGGENSACGIAPDMSTVEDPAAPPANTTYGVTAADGTGQVTFVVSTDAQNPSLGCSNTVACALVIIPIMGLNCDGTVSGGDGQPTAADVAACESPGFYQPGAPLNNDLDGLDAPTSDTGALWWSASNWRNRITVPLTFAPPAGTCAIVSSQPPIDLYGSELLNQASASWQTKFCTDPRLFPFQHVRTAEPLAKTALGMGSIDAALISRPPDGGYSAPTVNAPIAVTGFAISYVIDDAQKHEYTSLRLNARLIAKLLSESYWSRQALQHDYQQLPASNPYAKMAKNPEDISVDPEFVKLNPGVGATVQTQAAATLLALSGNSDVMYALTTYLNDDPEARAFLNGTPDPWGMVVNPGYRKIPLPTESWPLLDTFKSPDIDLDGCLRDEKSEIVPVPILPLVAAPVSSLTTIAQDMQFAIANSTTACSPLLTQGGLLAGGTLKAIGREQPGARFMLGLTSAGDTQLFGLRNAALQSSTGHYVAPTNASMKAAMALAKVDTHTHTWPIPYAKLRTSASAYPGTMVVYAAIPTTGLDTATSTKLAQFLTYAAGAGQVTGPDIGQLPAGFLPMTSGNGLSALVSYTRKAAGIVAAQQGDAPPSSSGGGGSGGSGGAGGGTPGAPSQPSASASPPYIPPVDEPVGYTSAVRSATAAWALPVAILVSIGFMVIAIVVRAVAGMNSAATMHNRLRRLNADPLVRNADPLVRNADPFVRNAGTETRDGS